AKVLQEGGHRVVLWGHDAAHVEEVRSSGRNERCLPGIDLPRDIFLEADLGRAAAQAAFVVVAVPSKAFREVTKCLANFGGTIVSVTKGIEYDTGRTMCGILAE